MKRRFESVLVVLIALAVIGGLAWQSFGSDGETPAVGRSADEVVQVDQSNDAPVAMADGDDQANDDQANDDQANDDQADVAQEIDTPADTEIVYDWVVSVDELPDEAIDTLLLIDSDGPFPYSKDGTTFQNREGLLPDEQRGYYREFTVDTPGLSHRGALRIVAGDRGELFYTADHYDSFAQIIGW